MHRPISRKITRREALLKISGGLSASIMSPLSGRSAIDTLVPLSKNATKRRLLIKNGIVIDGNGTPGIQKDVLIVDGLIDGIGCYTQESADQVLDATDHVVCPGFIDLHTHCKNGDNPAFVHQGVTTVITGNCGFSSTMKTLSAEYKKSRKTCQHWQFGRT